MSTTDGSNGTGGGGAPGPGGGSGAGPGGGLSGATTGGMFYGDIFNYYFMFLQCVYV